MMDHMIELAQQFLVPLQNLLQDALGSYSVRGAILEVDRFWIRAFLQSKHRWYYPGWDFGDGLLMQHASLLEPIPWDYNFRPSGWDEHCKIMGYGSGANPFVIRVILRHRKKDQSGEWPRIHEGCPIIYEYRPPVIAASLSTLASRLREVILSEDREVGPRSATSIGRRDPNTAGTLGGYVRHRATGAVYLVSCFHVLGPPDTPVYSPGPYEGHSGARIATVTFHHFPPPSRPNSDCNLFGLPDAPKLDLAVAELYESAEPHGLNLEKSADGVRDPARMNPYQPVAFVGKESGRVDAQLTGVTIWHELLFPDAAGNYVPHCFGTIFEMSGLRGDRKDLVKSGDSGAWIIDEAGGVRMWNGMLVARLGARAYGCYAQFIIDACNAAQEFPGGVALL
jgi:hypothetical protein